MNHQATYKEHALTKRHGKLAWHSLTKSLNPKRRHHDCTMHQLKGSTPASLQYTYIFRFVLNACMRSRQRNVSAWYLQGASQPVNHPINTNKWMCMHGHLALSTYYTNYTVLYVLYCWIDMCDGPLLPSNPFLHIGVGQLSVIWSQVNPSVWGALYATFAVFDSVDFCGAFSGRLLGRNWWVRQVVIREAEAQKKNGNVQGASFLCIRRAASRTQCRQLK